MVNGQRREAFCVIPCFYQGELSQELDQTSHQISELNWVDAQTLSAGEPRAIIGALQEGDPLKLGSSQNRLFTEN